MSAENDLGIVGTEGIIDSEATLFMSVLSGRLCPLAECCEVFGVSCPLKVEFEEDIEVREGVTLSIDPFSVRECLEDEGDGDLELEIQDLRASLDRDRDIDLLFPIAAVGHVPFALRISNPSSSVLGGESTTDCATRSVDSKAESFIARAPTFVSIPSLSFRSSSPRSPLCLLLANCPLQSTSTFSDKVRRTESPPAVSERPANWFELAERVKAAASMLGRCEGGNPLEVSCPGLGKRDNRFHDDEGYPTATADVIVRVWEPAPIATFCPNFYLQIKKPK